MPLSPVVLQVGNQSYGVIILYVALFVAFYLFALRPQRTQQRQRREMLGKLKKGDRIVTMGGLHATLLDIDGDILTVELAPNIRVKADRSAVSYLRNRKREESTSVAPTPRPA
ncbi:MAG: preprotein translocase subunit YajC [Armatimonadetes bacterium 13_1_40CM_64_14]|nr:MAG: preprotein translocase subunit YajC [Armatimonadetes bacterium 13_1_40CM_64_14]